MQQLSQIWQLTNLQWIMSPLFWTCLLSTRRYAASPIFVLFFPSGSFDFLMVENTIRLGLKGQVDALKIASLCGNEKELRNMVLHRRPQRVKTNLVISKSFS